MRRLLNIDSMRYGVNPTVAAGFSGKQVEFGVALQNSSDPLTRGKRTVFLKNEAKKQLVKLTRELARQINNTLSVTDQQRQELGLTIRKVEPTPVPVPSGKPKIEVIKIDGHRVTLRLSDVEKPKSLAKPAGTAGASVFSFVGVSPPGDFQNWTFESNVTRPSETTLSFDQSLALGTQVWFTAFWYNPRGQSGPATNPVSTLIQFGGLSKGTIRSTQTGTLKAA